MLMLIIFKKPLGKQSCSHCLAIISCFTLIQENIWIRQEKLFDETLYCFLYLWIIGRVVVILIENSKLIRSIFPNILILRKFYTILNTVICHKNIGSVSYPNFIWRIKVETRQVKGLHNSLPPPCVPKQNPPGLSFPILSFAEPFDAKLPKLPHDYCIL